MFNSIGFIGAGRIAHIMLEGWQRAGTKLPEIHACDQSQDAIAALQRAFPKVRAATLVEASSQALVFGALHPPAMGEALSEIGKHLHTNAVFCSLSPVIKLPALEQRLGGFARLARLNPNAPSIVGSGFNPTSFGAGLPKDARTALLALLEPLGACPQVDDHMIETYAVVSAMGPTYFWFQFEELRRMAGSWGMGAEEAKKAMAAMLHGAVDTMFASDLNPEQVMDLVPVRPMAGDEDAIRGMLQSRIGAIHSKLHPAP
jgi:pyrroline-5-carboxylate reductase